MAYKIYYGPSGRNISKPRMGRVKLLTSIFFLLFSVIAHYFFADQLASLRAILLPQDRLEELLETLRSGEDLVQAVGAFCKEIIDAA